MVGRDTTGMGVVVHNALEAVRDRNQVAAINRVAEAAQRANDDAHSWKNYAEKLAATLEKNKASTKEWADYAKALSDRVKWLENNLKRQSANRAGLDAIRELLVAELGRFADPEQCKALDPAVRKQAFDEEFDKFMKGDAITF